MLPAAGVTGDAVVISLGVNDGDNIDTLTNLQELRARVSAPTVYWLLPGLKEDVRRAIRSVARDNGDRTIDTLPEVGRDHLHPNGTGYQRLAAQTLGGDSEVEVAYAPVERSVPTALSRHRAHAVAERGLRYPRTPRERIERLRALRQSEMSAPVLRRTLSGAAHVQRTPQHEVRMTATVTKAAAHCPAHAHDCRPLLRR
jgi:hypothetical protein